MSDERAVLTDSGHDQAVDGLEAEFGTLFTRIRRAYATLARHLGSTLSPADYRVLAVIAQQEGTRLSVLARNLEADKATVSRSVRALDEAGLLHRAPSPQDARAALLTLSPLGADRLRILRDGHDETVLRPLRAWPASEIRHVARLVHALGVRERPRDDGSMERKASPFPEETAMTDTAPDARSDRDAAVTELSAEFGAFFSRVRRVFRETADAVAPGLQPGAYQVLSRIASRDGVTASMLVEMLDSDKSIISRALRDLEALDLIERRVDPADRRSSLIVLTAHGRERLEAGRDPMRQAFRDTLDDWSTTDIASLTALLRALTSAEVR